MKKFILFCVRIKIGVKKWEKFRFKNQRSKKDYYYFNNNGLIKACFMNKESKYPTRTASNVSLNWLLNKDCNIVKVKER